MNKKIITKALSLSSSNNRPTHYRIATEDDIKKILSIVGESFIDYLNELEASIYICKNPLEHSKEEVSSEPYYPHNTYSVGIIYENHLIFLYLYESTFWIFPTSLEISFVFKSDYNKGKNTLYTRTKKLRYIKGENNLDTSNIRFLIILKRLIEKINKKTKVVIYYTTRQRGRVYKNALHHLKNVRIKPTHISTKKSL